MSDAVTTDDAGTRWLPVKLTDAELLDKARELAHTQEELEEAELDKAAKMKSLGERIKELKGTLGTLSKQVRTCQEYREVECQWEYVWDQNLAKLVRVDTGEVLTERAITASERQMHLDGVDDDSQDQEQPEATQF